MRIDQEVSFRPCIPSDVDLAVPLIYSSGPTSFDYVFKRKKQDAQDFLKHAFITKGGEFSFDNHVAMVYNDELVGIGSSFTGANASSFLMHDPIKIIKYYKLASPKTLLRGLKTEQVIKLPKTKEIALAHIAIKKEMRSKGLGQKLMEYLMNQKDLDDDSYFILDVSELNPRAKALYEQLGFEVKSLEKSNLKNEYGFVANHYRMEKRKTSK